ncbi:hypothetical protein ACFVUS_23080 [Nocardia sp. NPDC058058]|uniref:hypothetical protein n=1 Tax=Nocardia sp. NPDC058058 TaxID=3346317 RepID=UPI0036DD1ABF
MADPYQHQPFYDPARLGAPDTGSGMPFTQSVGPLVSQPVWTPPIAQPAPNLLIAIGDIAVVGGAVVTPSGTLPLRGAIWTATDMSHAADRIPAYAVVLTILFLPLCFLGLFFLLIKERVITGFVQVTVTAGGRFHTTMIPVLDQQTFPTIVYQLNYARSLSAM